VFLRLQAKTEERCFMKVSRLGWWVIPSLLVIGCVATAAIGQSVASPPLVRQIIVPGEDRFTPFAITIRVGQTVEWVNNDSDDHTIVSDDAFNTAGHLGTNVLLPANGGTFKLRFTRQGVFPFYCRFHAMLDADNQPKAPGPDGGIQDPNGNFGTPMNGIITVVGDQ
jgi:plastocyanin